MKQTACYFWLISFLFTFVSVNFAQPNIAKSVDEYLSAKAKLGRFNGVALIAKGDKIILRKGYGFADIENKILFTPKTKFMVASITKMFTAMAILKLQNVGKLKTSDSICKYIKNCPNKWKLITIENLVRHNSGIPDYEGKLKLGSEKYFEFMNQENASAKIIEEAKILPLEFSSGEKFKYSNTGYVLLAQIIEATSGQSFAKFLKEKVLRPSKMKSSGMFDSKKTVKNVSKGYTNGTIPWADFLAGVSVTSKHFKKVQGLKFSATEGDAGLFSTVDDLFRWSRFMDNGKSVSSKFANEVFNPKDGFYGYGWFITKQFNRKKIWHTGSLPGYLSEFIKFPEENLTIILFSNLDRSRLSTTSRDVSAIVLGEPYDLPVKGNVIKLSKKQIANLEGDYKTDDGKSLKIIYEEKYPEYISAYMWGANKKIEFIAGWVPMSANEFYFPMKNGKVTFTLDRDGRATKVNMRYRGINHVAQRIEKKN